MNWWFFVSFFISVYFTILVKSDWNEHTLKISCYIRSFLSTSTLNLYCHPTPFKKLSVINCNLGNSTHSKLSGWSSISVTVQPNSPNQVATWLLGYIFNSVVRDLAKCATGLGIVPHPPWLTTLHLVLEVGCPQLKCKVVKTCICICISTLHDPKWSKKDNCVYKCAW